MCKNITLKNLKNLKVPLSYKTRQLFFSVSPVVQKHSDKHFLFGLLTIFQKSRMQNHTAAKYPLPVSSREKKPPPSSPDNVILCWLRLNLTIFQGLFTWREEDPSTRKILEGGTTFSWVYMQKFQSIWCPRREGIKDGGQQKQTCNLGPSTPILAFIAELAESAELSL